MKKIEFKTLISIAAKNDIAVLLCFLQHPHTISFFIPSFWSMRLIDKKFTYFIFSLYNCKSIISRSIIKNDKTIYIIANMIKKSGKILLFILNCNHSNNFKRISLIKILYTREYFSKYIHYVLSNFL